MAADPKAEVRAFFASLSPDVRAAPPPPTVLPCERRLASTLHSYQRQAVEWAMAREKAGVDEAGVCGGVLAEEMGLGKSIEVIALVESHACPLHDPPPPEATAGGRIPHCSGLLLPRTSCGGEACIVCGRKSMASETVHVATGTGFVCCGWCFLPHQPSAVFVQPEHARSSSDVSLGSTEAAASDGGALESDAAAAAEAPAALRRRLAVSFADEMLGGPSKPNVAKLTVETPSTTVDRAVTTPQGAPACTAASLSGFKIRIKRPREEASALAAAVAATAAGVPGLAHTAGAGLEAGALGTALGGTPLCGATLIVAPSSIHKQWLDEIAKHAPTLSARVLVYPGLRELCKGAGAGAAGAHHVASTAQLIEAVDRARVVLTTYREASVSQDKSRRNPSQKAMKSHKERCQRACVAFCEAVPDPACNAAQKISGHA